MWEISSLQQWTAFFESVVLGVMLGVIYRILSLDRRVFKRKSKTVFFEDIIFSLLSAFLTFCFMLINTNGAVRFYVFLGEGIGFFIVIRLTAPVLKKVVKPLKKLFLKLNSSYRKLIIKYSSFSVLRVFSGKKAETAEKSAENL